MYDNMWIEKLFQYLSIPKIYLNIYKLMSKTLLFGEYNK